jgi:hypothetical protein
MTRTTIVTALIFALGVAAGCKGQTIVQPDPQTKSDLDQCLKDKAEKDKLIKAEEDENARLMREKGSGAEITVNIEGNALTIKPSAPGETRPIDDKAALAATNEFMSLVGRSRGAIQKCYEQALKKNTGLQAKTVTLSVQATFTTGGQYQSASFAPSLGDTFDACIRSVASRWTLSNNPPVQSFKAQFSLTPS